MKLVHPTIEKQIDFNISNCYEMVIENSNEFFKLTSDIINQSNSLEGNFVLSDGKLLDISKNCLVIYDYYNLNLMTKKISNLINFEVLEILKNGDFIEEFSSINKTLIDVSERVKDKLDFLVETNQEFDYETFTKYSNFKVIKTNVLAYDLQELIAIMQKLSNIKIIILINPNSFFNENEIKSLIKQLSYMQLNILLINNMQKYRLENINRIIIDEDLCEI